MLNFNLNAYESSKIEKLCEFVQNVCKFENF